MRGLKVIGNGVLLIAAIAVFLSAVSAYVRFTPPLSIPFVPLRMLLQMTMKFQIPILVVVLVGGGIIFTREVMLEGKPRKLPVVCGLLLLAALLLEVYNVIELHQAAAWKSNLSYTDSDAGEGRPAYQLERYKSYAQELDMKQCEIYQDSDSRYKSTCLIYLNYGGWGVQDESYGTQLRKFCQREGYTFVRFGVERKDDENILELTRAINGRLNKLLEKEKYGQVILCGGSAGGHLALLCAGKQTRELDEAVFGLRESEASYYNATAIRNSMEKNIPLLVVQGDKDSMMPIEGARALYQELSKRGQPITYLELPGAEHVFDMTASVAWDRCERELTGFVRSL